MKPSGLTNQRRKFFFYGGNKKSEKKVMEKGGGVKMSQADEIRGFVKKDCIDPAREKGLRRVTVRAGEVARQVTSGTNIPNVNNALRGQKFLEMAGVKLIETGGTPGSSTATYTYEILPIKGDNAMIEEYPAAQTAAAVTVSTRGLKCPQCEFINEEDSRFCEQCGAQLNICPRCHSPIKLSSKFCSNCGAKL